MIRNTYPNALAFFQHLLLSSDFIDGNSLDDSLFYNQMFNSTLASLKASRQIVECAPKQYISANKLLEKGITKARIDAFCQAVSRFVKEDSYFTIKSLQQDGFADELLEESILGEWFYNSLLAEEKSTFSSQTIRGTRVFRKGKSQFAFVDFMSSLVAERKRIKLVELMGLLEGKYGVAMPKDKVVYLIRNATEMYYDSVAEAVFISYAAYEHGII